MIPRDAKGGAAADFIRVLAYLPKEPTAHVPVLLHIHGGGYVIGSPDMMDGANRGLAADLKCAIFSVDYRLAPETRFPGAVEDCYTVLKWLTSNPDELPIDVGRIGVKGESAGGGLAAALALLVRDRGELTLAFQHLIYPMIDDRTCIVADPHPFAGEFVWGPENNRFGWAALLGTEPGGPDISCYAAAARADRLDGLPSTFISVGALDLFLEEDLEYARRLTRAGVAVELHVYPGAFHGFQMAPSARVSIASERDSRDAMRKAFYG
jgi:triacylglycerol lipase